MITKKETKMGSTPESDAIVARVMKSIETRTAVAGVIGLGYVGLPLAVEIGRSGYRTIGATTDMSLMAQCDVISICVPTPLSKTKDPDLSYVLSRAARSLPSTLRPGQLIILESTTFPGTTRDVLLPLLEESGSGPAGLLRLLQPRTRGPRQHGVDHEEHAEGAGRRDGRALAAGVAFYSRTCSTTSCRSRAPRRRSS
jgi:hypothetical protein